MNEFANLVGETHYTLQHYDKTDVFKPAISETKHRNTYHYYLPTQITAFNMIRVLSKIGVPINIIKAYADGGKTPLSLLKLLSKQKDILAYKLNSIQEDYSLISTQLELLKNGLSATENEVYATEMPEELIILGDVCNFDGADCFYGEFTRFCNGEFDPKLNPAYPIGGYWESWNDFLSKTSESTTLPTRFFSLDPKGKQQKPAGLYMIAYTRGYYGKINDLPKRMTAYAKKYDLEFNGPVYHFYLFDELCIGDPNEYLLQACASVKKTKQIPLCRNYNP
jgi:DNA-binding transcriptional MerR regulator